MYTIHLKKMYLYIFDIFKFIYIQLMKDLVLNLQTFLFSITIGFLIIDIPHSIFIINH